MIRSSEKLNYLNVRAALKLAITDLIHACCRSKMGVKGGCPEQLSVEVLRLKLIYICVGFFFGRHLQYRRVVMH